ncbi:thymidine kinase [Mycoplasmatota bacterium]|nr:thymidine kinase [Mycoplasmatota bacterium]
MYYTGKDGWIEVICGSMFAGKTEELIRRIKRLQYAKKNILVFKPNIDDRYSLDEVVSHSGMSIKSIIIDEPMDILKHIDGRIDAVAIDEIQFLDEKVVTIVDYLADKGIRVIVAGLDRDFRAEPFGPMPELLTKAEFVTKLTAICSVCGAPATRTQRLVNNRPASFHDPIVLVGASESYEPRCRHCHQVPNRPQI